MVQTAMRHRETNVIGLLQLQISIYKFFRSRLPPAIDPHSDAGCKKGCASCAPLSCCSREVSKHEFANELPSHAPRLLPKQLAEGRSLPCGAQLLQARACFSTFRGWPSAIRIATFLSEGIFSARTRSRMLTNVIDPLLLRGHFSENG